MLALHLYNIYNNILGILRIKDLASCVTYDSKNLLWYKKYYLLKLFYVIEGNDLKNSIFCTWASLMAYDFSIPNPYSVYIILYKRL